MDGRRGNYRRKAHHKTRSGCLDCRRRRVKCTEEKPFCRSCIRRDLTCRYPPPFTPKAQRQAISEHDTRSASLPASGLASSATSNSHPGSPRPSIVTPTTFGLEELALLHHWTTSTCKDVSNQPHSEELWQVEIPKMAFKHHFLLYAILSVAVIHRHSLDPQRGNSQAIALAATQYHHQGLRGFQTEVSRMNLSNHEALFVWSTLNSVYVFSLPRETHREARQSSGPETYDTWRDRVLGAEWIPLNRGVTSLMGHRGVKLQETRLKSMFPNAIPDWDTVELNDKNRCPGLQRVQETWAGNTQADTYTHTQEILDRAFVALSTQRGFHEEVSRAEMATFAAYLFFPVHMFSDEYLRLLRQRQPPALILFSFYGAFLHKARRFWAFRGWGWDIVTVASELLGSYWKPWIEWPLEVIAEGNEEGDIS